MPCNCLNGATLSDFQSLVPGGTADNATYLLGLTQYTCGNRKMPINDDAYPVIANLTASVIGTPKNVGNGSFCCQVQVLGTVTYRPCNCCEPKQVYVVKNLFLPCPTAEAPTLTIGEVIAQPQPISYFNGCCSSYYSCTNKISITTSLNVASAAQANG